MMIHVWFILYLIDIVLLITLGIFDYLTGESPGSLTIACYVTALLVYLFLPVPSAYKAILFVTHMVLAATIAVMYYRGGIGLMDFVIAPNLPLLLVNPIHVEHLAIGTLGAIAALLVHVARVKGRCDGRLVPGGIIMVSGKEAYRKWYYFPVGVHAEIPEEELEKIKRKWRNKKCVKVRFVVPLVWVYSVFHITASIFLISLYL